MPFGNPLDKTTTTAMQPQQVPQPPAFRPWADAQIGQMSGGTAKTWDDLDAAFDALPAEPGKDKRDQAAQLKRQLLDTYTGSVLPQYYPDPKALSAAKAYAESQMAPHILGSAFKPLIAQKESAANDKTADQQDTFTRLAEQRDDAAQSAKAAIHLDQLTRKNGQKYIQELGLADMDTDLADEFIKTEKAKRVAKSLEIEQQYAAMQIDYATAQAELDRLYRENQNLDGARMVLHDNNGFVESGAYALGGVAKGLLAIPELLGRTYSGTVSGLSGEGFGKGWQDEATVGGWMGHLAEEVSDWQQEISKYDEKAVAQQYMMQAFDAGGMEAGMEVLASNPEIAWEMLATSGVDSIAGFFTGGTVVKGARVAGNIAVDGAKALPKLLQSSKSLTAMKDVMVGATKAANTSRGAGAAFTAGAIAIPSISAGLTDARESGEWMRGQLDAMSEDQFLSMKEIQAEQSIWSGMDNARRAEYIRNKKDDLVGQMMAEQTAVISAGLAATGYLGTKFGLEKFLLGSKAATIGTVNAGKAAAVQGVAGGALEAGEEVFETGVQHLFVNSYLDRDVGSATPFDNFSGAAVSGFIVGGPMDAGGAYMGAKRTNDAEAKIVAQQKANDARRAAGQTINPKDVAAAQSAEAAKKAWIAKEVQSQIAAENAARAATDARPEAWTGGSFVDKDGKLITMDAQKFTDAELDDADVQQRIDAAFAEFTKDTDPYSPMAILTSPDGMGLTGKQKGDLEYTYNLATDPKEQDKILQYRAKVEVLAMTNRIRLSEVGKDFYGIVRKAMSPNFVMGETKTPPARPYAKADPLSMGLPRLEASPTYYPLQDASAVDATWADELPQFQPQITGGIIYGESPEFFIDVQEVLGLPAPPKPPVDTRGIDGLQNFPQDRFAARSNQQVGFPIVDAQWETDPLADAVGMAIDHGATQQRQAYEDELITLLEETAEQRAQQEAQAAAAEQAKQPRPLPSDSRSALAAGAGVPLARATVTVASVVEGDVGVQVVANDDGSMSVILSGNADDEVRIHAMEINSVVDSVRNAAGNNDPLAVTQMALDAIMNRVRQLGVKTKGLVPAVRFAVATEAMKRVDGEALTGRNMAARKRKAASLLFLQRTIEEDRARVLDPRGRTALEYVTGVRDVLPRKHKEYADILNAARIKWHETDGLLRKTGLYNQLDAAGHKVGVGKPQPKAKAKSLAEAVRQDVVEKGSVAANDAADAIADGGLPTVEQAAAIVDAVNTVTKPLAPAAQLFHPARYGFDMLSMPLDDVTLLEDTLRGDSVTGNQLKFAERKLSNSLRDMRDAVDERLQASIDSLPKVDLAKVLLPNISDVTEAEAASVSSSRVAGMMGYLKPSVADDPGYETYIKKALALFNRYVHTVGYGTHAEFRAVYGHNDPAGEFLRRILGPSVDKRKFNTRRGPSDYTLGLDFTRDVELDASTMAPAAHQAYLTASEFVAESARRDAQLRSAISAHEKAVKFAGGKDPTGNRKIMLARWKGEGNYGDLDGEALLMVDLVGAVYDAENFGPRSNYYNEPQRLNQFGNPMDAEEVRASRAAEEAAERGAAVPVSAPPPTVVTDRTIKDAIAAYESDPRTLRWKELKTREDRIIREGDLLPPRTDQEQSDSAWTKAERARIARMQIESQNDLLDDPELAEAIAKLNRSSELKAAQRREDEAYANKMRGLIVKYADARRSSQPGDPAAMRKLVNSVRGKNPDWVNGVAPFVDDDTHNLATLIDHIITNVFGRPTAVKFEYIDQNNKDRAGGHDLNRVTGEAVVTVKVGNRGGEALPTRRQAYTLVHEQMHRATSAIYNWGAYLRDHWNDVVDTLTPNDLIAVQFFDDMTSIYNQTIDRLVSRGVPRAAVMEMRGMKDANEFMAEVARPEFRDILNNVYLGDRQTLLHRVMRAIAQMLGVKPGTALDRTMTAIGNMWHEVDAKGEAAEFFTPLQQADRVARAAKYGLGSDEFDAYIAASLEDVPINSTLWTTVTDPMDGC